jgi:hypothetical protein
MKGFTMPISVDGPASGQFRPVAIRGNVRLGQLPAAGVSVEMAKRIVHAPAGKCVSWGIPFDIRGVILIKDKPVRVKLKPGRAQWVIFLHAADVPPAVDDRGGIMPLAQRPGQLGEHLADYVVAYADGAEIRLPIRHRHEVGAITHKWGDNCVRAVAHRKPRPRQAGPDQVNPNCLWGFNQCGADANDGGPWLNWLWAWENPRPDQPIVAIRFEPVAGAIVLSGISVGEASSMPLRWQTRQKAILRLPPGVKLDGNVDEMGLLKQIQLDMGQVISATPRPIYPTKDWPNTYNNRVPELSAREAIIEYAAHADARFHFPGGATLPVAKLDLGSTGLQPVQLGSTGFQPVHPKGAGYKPVVPKSGVSLQPLDPASRRVRVRVIDKTTRRPVPAKFHAHGLGGEYLPPVDRHRIPNSQWFQDYSPDFSHQGQHHCCYIDGDTTVDLPLGSVFLEVSKGFEAEAVRKIVRVTGSTAEIVVELEKVLPWRQRGWVSADTHVHFLSPPTAWLEGAGEGVNVVNLLASQWAELMTNVGDFDGRTTFGARDFGGSGEHLVRVGTENRQHVLGHISLLGYKGRIIAPMTTGGADESAIGDPVGTLLTHWARQCRRQGGIVVLPHFPNPQAEHAAAIVERLIDAVEMTSWGSLYGGIDPYSLADWYRYLNTGHLVPAVGGTDKMSASTAVGTVRTYARVRPAGRFDYAAWQDAIRRGETFVTYGPLLEFAVEGKPAGSRLAMKSSGGTVDVTYSVASVTVPMSRVELVVNGEVVRQQAVDARSHAGHWSAKLDRSSWLALLVRGHYPDKPEIIAAHSSPVVVEVKGSQILAAADAVTILNQIEGALAFIDEVGTRADTHTWKEMRLTLSAAARKLHNRMHQAGHFHEHKNSNG